ncbi:hypothetical protein LINPERPRIM_LOCUS18816, partial [Linum perenne]
FISLTYLFHLSHLILFLLFNFFSSPNSVNTTIFMVQVQVKLHHQRRNAHALHPEVDARRRCPPLMPAADA